VVSLPPKADGWAGCPLPLDHKSGLISKNDSKKGGEATKRTLYLRGRDDLKFVEGRGWAGCPLPLDPAGGAFGADGLAAAARLRCCM